MTEKESLHGLNCPLCGGMVPIAEGQRIVKCPYCELPSFVHGERGLQRYSVPLKIDRTSAQDGLRKFFTSNEAIIRNLEKKSKITETFLVYLPFWVNWSSVLGWVFGEEKVRIGDNTRYVPKEIQFTREMSWNKAACDVGEFGVTSIKLDPRILEPFNPDELHARGMVFEAIGSTSEALAAAREYFNQQVRDFADLPRIAQTFTRFTRSRLEIVYYPLWILRYTYRDRAFQVAIDGFTGKVLYGKAPGSNTHRAAVLVGGMAMGSFIAVDVASFIAYLGIKLESDDILGFFGAALAVFVAGLGLMRTAYQKYRHGEIFEFGNHLPKDIHGDQNPITKVVRTLDEFL